MGPFLPINYAEPSAGTVLAANIQASQIPKILGLTSDRYLIDINQLSKPTAFGMISLIFLYLSDFRKYYFCGSGNLDLVQIDQ